MGLKERDQMKKTIDQFINDEQNNSGLLLIDMPTGFGKTYLASESMYHYALDNKDKKIFYITTLIKNLPCQELQNVYKKHGHESQYEKDVLVIKSNYDYICDSIMEVEIPEEFKTGTYYELIRKIKQIKDLENRKDASIKQFITTLEDEVRNKFEPLFRYEIIDLIKQNMPKGVVARRNIIRKNSDYQWIAKLYPTVFMDDYKIFMLTVNKFMVRNTTLVEPSYEFLKNDITQNAIIFIDEFDATKETIQNVIIDRALASQDDYIKLFEQIYKTLQVHIFPRNMLRPYIEYTTENSAQITFDSLVSDAAELYEQYHMKYSYKTASGSVDKRQCFLFNDSSYHTMLRNNCNYIRVTPDEEAQQVSIFFENKEEYYKHRSKDDVVIYGLIRAINSYLNKFKLMVLNWATRYAEDVNQSRSDEDDEFFVENAMKSIYKEFALSQKQIEILMGDLCYKSVQDEHEERDIPDLSFYNNGFKYFEFVDGDDHLSQTILNYVQILDTPEKILLYLSKKSKVIGISATATLPSVVGNYDLNYLKNELGKLYSCAIDKSYQSIEVELKQRWKAYEEGIVKVNVDIVNKNKTGMDLKERLSLVFQERDYINKYCNTLMQKAGDDSFIWKRYCEIIEVIASFVKNAEIKSLLCLNMVLPASKKTNFDLDVFTEALVDLQDIYEIDESGRGSIVVLRSDNFDADKEIALSRLENGEKLFIMSSYQTIGAGQNLQYKIPKGENCINIFDTGIENDVRLQMKDMDALYLGTITNLVANTYDRERFGKKEMLEYFFAAEYLYQNDEISFSSLNNLIKTGFKAYSGSVGRDSGADSTMRQTSSISLKATRDVIQAVGRISRTYNKKSNIYLFTTIELLNEIVIDKMNPALTSPEMNELIKQCRLLGKQYTHEEETALRKAERISSQGKNYIMRMLSRNWTPRSMSLWKQLRDIVLTNPTADRKIWETNNVIKDLYISDEKKTAKYLFAQKGDFSDVILDYGDDKTSFGKSKRCDGRNVSEVSDDEARLNRIMMYPGMKAHFEQNGWATSFEPKDYILSPVLFQNIYKGALGEVVGAYLFHKELGIKLQEINNPDYFEFFDYEIISGVYIDFKHWKMNYPDDREMKKNEIRAKLDHTQGEKVYIINLFSEEGYDYHKQNDGRIIEIPGLLNGNGTINKNTINFLRGEILNDIEQ